jgi:colanic acid biosynthesis glycosyl transferase WcaI
MRILYVSQYFPPEMGAPAARVHELAREWVRLGHEVTVLTAFAHHPTGIKAPQDNWTLTRRERVDGIDVIRTYVYAAPNKGTARRMLSYASFMCSAALIGAYRVSMPDVVIATSPQLLCGAAGYFLSKVLSRPFVFEVRDLWPESIVAVDAMRDNPFLSGLRRTANFLYRASDCIVTVGSGYKRLIEQRYNINAEKMAVIPNGIDTQLFIPGPRENAIREQYGWNDRFVVLYIGTHGMAHGLDSVLRAAKLMISEPEFLFVFVGEGAEKENLMRMAASEALPNVQFIGQQPKSVVPDYYAACDLGLVTLRDTPLFQEVLPSKLFEYMGMERPVLLSVGGEARRLVEEAGGGEFVAPGDSAAMAGAIRRLAVDRAALAAMGRNGRQFVVRHYDRRRLAKEYLDVLEYVVRGGHATH